jgi:hypothetical protein
VTALSVKYGGVTTGSSFAVNTQYKLVAKPDSQSEDSLVLPPPPNDLAISFGEDRTAQLDPSTNSAPAPAKTALAAKAKYYLQQRGLGFPYYLNKISGVAPFAVPIGALFVLLLVFRRIDARKHREALITAGVLIVYFLGYAAIAAPSSQGGNIRYYWPLLALSSMVAALLWPAFWARFGRMGGWWRRALAVALILIIPAAAFTQHGLNTAYPFSTTKTYAAIFYLRNSPVKAGTQTLAEEMLRDGVVPAHSKLVGGSGFNVKTIKYAFYIGAQVYGREVPHNINDPRFQALLRQDKIDYYFLYEPEDKTPLDVSAWGTIKKTYDLSNGCGGQPGEGCRLSIVAVTP